MGTNTQYRSEPVSVGINQAMKSWKAVTYSPFAAVQSLQLAIKSFPSVIVTKLLIIDPLGIVKFLDEEKLIGL